MDFILNLLANESEAANSNANANTPAGGSGWFLWALVGLMVLFLVYTFISGRKRNKKMEEEKARLSDIHPGYKVTTIGGVVGTVVEVDDETNSFVLKTGTEDNCSYLTFDKQAIYQSSNPAEQTETATEEKVAEETPVEETVAEETSTEEKAAEETSTEEKGENA